MKIKVKNDPYKHFIYELNSDNFFRFVPERGGLVTEWISNGKNILYFDSERFQNQLKSVRGGIPILFPICGDLRSDYPIFQNASNLLPQHGFARDLNWFLIDDCCNNVEMILVDNSQTRSMYPFKFCIKMKIFIDIGKLLFKISIQNKNSFSMPYSFGVHPYFLISGWDNLEITGIPNEGINHQDFSSIKTSSIMANLSKGIDFITSSNGSSSIIDKNNDSFISLFANDSFQWTVFWTDPPRKMICMEPWTSPRNALTNQNLRLEIPPNETAYLDLQIESKTIT